VVRSMTVVVSETSLRWLKVPALIEGNHINLPGGIITIADACSGLNLLLATLLIGTLQVQMGNYSSRRRALLLFIAALFGLLDNWIRVVALVLIAHASNMQNPLVYDHASFGWWIYAGSLVPFFLIASRLESNARTRESAMPVRNLSSPLTATPIAHALVLIAVVFCGGLGVKTLLNREGSAHAGLSVEGGAQAITPSFKPHYAGYDREQAWLVSDESGNYELLALTYLRQSPDKKLIYYNNVIADEVHLQSSAKFTTPTGHEINVSTVQDNSTASGPEWRVVWWYYWVDGRVVTSPQKTKLYQLRSALLGDPTSALITLSRTCNEPSCAAEIESAQHFISDKNVFTQMLALRRAP